jgi:hypothetical protein
VVDAMVTAPKAFGAESTVAAMHELFADDHIRAALLVDADRLLAVVECSTCEPISLRTAVPEASWPGLLLRRPRRRTELLLTVLIVDRTTSGAASRSV